MRSIRKKNNFESLQEHLNLKLVKTNIFKSGVVQLIYEPLELVN
jgi:dihydrofolate reductase